MVELVFSWAAQEIDICLDRRLADEYVWKRRCRAGSFRHSCDIVERRRADTVQLAAAIACLIVLSRHRAFTFSCADQVCISSMNAISPAAPFTSRGRPSAGSSIRRIFRPAISDPCRATSAPVLTVRHVAIGDAHASPPPRRLPTPGSADSTGFFLVRGARTDGARISLVAADTGQLAVARRWVSAAIS